MTKIANRPSEARRNPHEDVVAEVCAETRRLNDNDLDAVAGGPAGQGCSTCSYKTGTYTLGTDQISTFLDFYFDG